MTSHYEQTISIICTQQTTFTCLNAFTHCITRNLFMSTQCNSGHHIITWWQAIKRMNDLSNSTPPFQLHSLIKLCLLTIFLVLTFWKFNCFSLHLVWRIHWICDINFYMKPFEQTTGTLHLCCVQMLVNIKLQILPLWCSFTLAEEGVCDWVQD